MADMAGRQAATVDLPREVGTRPALQTNCTLSYSEKSRRCWVGSAIILCPYIMYTTTARKETIAQEFSQIVHCYQL